MPPSLPGSTVPLRHKPTLIQTHRMFPSLPIKIIPSLAVLALPTLAFSKSPLPIKELIDQALGNNPEIAFYTGEIVAAKASRSTAGRLRNPELDLQIGQRKTSADGFSTEGLAYSVSLAQPIDWPGRLGLRKSIANGDIKLAELGLQRFQTFLAGEVQSLAYRLSILQTKATIADEVSDRFAAVKNVLVQREIGGVTPLLEIRAIDAASVIMEKAALDATIEMQKVLLRLNQLMGRRAAAPLSVATTSYHFPELPSIGVLLADALENNYAMHIRRAELAQQGLRVSLAEKERFPAMKIGPYFTREEAGDRDRESEAGVGLSLELPVFRSGRVKVERATTRKMQAVASMHAAARDLERRVAEATLIYKNSQQRLQNWSQERLESFREAADLADRHYRLGAVPVSIYIELQEGYLDAIEAINEVKAEAIEAALLLETLTGVTQAKLETTTQKP